jgi:hypothetical protein
MERQTQEPFILLIHRAPTELFLAQLNEAYIAGLWLGSGKYESVSGTSAQCSLINLPL